MRIGSNPEKAKATSLEHKSHRVILPFWIPNTHDDYFKQQPLVLRHCLQSLCDTIHHQHTNITLVNNNSCPEAAAIAEEFVGKGLIDKYVVRSQNRGKLENVLAEARASYEDFVTICDADFLFFDGWEKAVRDTFRNFPLAGMVTCFPAAHLAYSFNSNMIWVPKFKGKIVDDHCIDEFEQGIGHQVDKGLYSKTGIKRKTSWRQQQYYLKDNKGNVALLGAVHALATYRRSVIDAFNRQKVDYVFKNGYEHHYIDFAVEKTGYLRMSSPKGYAYHLGNTVPADVIQKHKASGNLQMKADDWHIPAKNTRVNCFKFLFVFTSICYRLLRKYNLV
jgi:hypothetical protein